MKDMTKDKTMVAMNLLYALVLLFVCVVLTILTPSGFPEIEGRMFLGRGLLDIDCSAQLVLRCCRSI